ncbi:DUF2306 domain-containing protein [Tropicibacter sp. S64]|uniref:DUF2306 domain-containing protein n=1 Tax=Tropicibacter sp. S64 TaxID=3415122 RepID=UPI003C7DF551
MSLDPLLAAPLATQIHALAAVVALTVGPVALYRRRRDRLHRTLGYIWVLAMAILALSSFAIQGFRVIGPFSPIHLLSILVLVSLWTGVRHAVQGRAEAHRQTMIALFWRALCAAGLLTFLPGRLVNRIVFGEHETLGYWAIGLGLGLLIAQWLVARFGRVFRRPDARGRNLAETAKTRIFALGITWGFR